MSISSHAVLDALRRVPLFAELSEAEITSIAAKVSIEQYGANQVVFCEGGRGGDVLIVKEGSLKTVMMAPNGRHQLIAIERPGSSLGEISAFDGGAYSTTAITIVPAVLLRLDGMHFRSRCLAQPKVALKVIGVLGHRLRHLGRLVEQLSFATVRDRLIAHLLGLAEERGIRCGASVEIDLDENNEELAGRLGTVRELVSATLDDCMARA